MSFRVGIGVDAHALEDGVPLVLGGVELVHPRGLQATPTATCSRTR
jgi:2-C-methyl-D-erythritol 2,4-cyclodiphosphate synthase